MTWVLAEAELTCRRGRTPCRLPPRRRRPRPRAGTTAA